MIHEYLYYDDYFLFDFYEEILSGIRTIAYSAHSANKERYYAVAIRYFFNGESIKSIAKHYNITYHAVYYIVNNVRYTLALIINSAKCCSYTIDLSHLHRNKKGYICGSYSIIE